MKVAVMADGEWDYLWGRNELETQKIDVLICADGGANLAISSGRIPDVLVGDLDSITTDNLSKCLENETKIIKYPAEKDQTDLELALDFAQNYLESHGQPENTILLYAAGGKRLDHLLGNVAIMLGAAQNKRTVIMTDKSYLAWIMLPGRETINATVGQLLSIIPLSEKAVVCSRGLYYELNHLTLWQNSARGVSNILRESKVELEVRQGNILVILFDKRHD